MGTKSTHNVSHKRTYILQHRNGSPQHTNLQNEIEQVELIQIGQLGPTCPAGVARCGGVAHVASRAGLTPVKLCFYYYFFLILL